MSEFFAVGDRPIDQNGILVVNDQGVEELIPPDRIWEWEPDSRGDAVTPEEFEAQESEGEQ